MQACLGSKTIKNVYFFISSDKIMKLNFRSYLSFENSDILMGGDEFHTRRMTLLRQIKGENAATTPASNFDAEPYGDMF